MDMTSDHLLIREPIVEKELPLILMQYQIDFTYDRCSRKRKKEQGTLHIKVLTEEKPKIQHRYIYSVLQHVPRKSIKIIWRMDFISMVGCIYSLLSILLVAHSYASRHILACLFIRFSDK
jgi:hypothetical protein